MMEMPSQTGSRSRLWLLSALFWAVVALGFVGWLARPPEERELANFATSLRGRTPGQRHNARLAARALDGIIIPPGGEFSFNQAVGPWTRDRGYKRAPVSFGGEMVITWGGGVCQVSSTLYNAALLAGMKILERDHHTWAPLYVPPGRDAAVARGIADLRFANPYSEPVRLEVEVRGETLICRLYSRAQPTVEFRLVTEIKEVFPSSPLVRYDQDLPAGRRVRYAAGRLGCTVRTYRLILHNGRVVGQELLSDDEYKSLSPQVRVGTGIGGD